MTKNELQQIKLRLKELRSACWDLSVGLTSLAADIRMGELRQLPAMEDRLTGLQRQFDDLRQELEGLSPPSDRGEAPPTSLPALESLLLGLHQSLKKEAMQILARVLKITHRDNPSFAPLRDCLNSAAELQRAMEGVSLPDIHPAAGDLVGGAHPLAVLLALVQERRRMSEEKIAGMQEAIAGAFGNLLFIAALTGKLHIPEAVDGKENRDDVVPAAGAPAANSETTLASVDDFQEQQSILQDLVVMTQMKIDKMIKSGVARENELTEFVAAMQGLGDSLPGKENYLEAFRKIHTIRAALDDLVTKSFTLRKSRGRPEELPRRPARDPFGKRNG